MICRPATGHPNARTHRQQTPAGRRSAMSGPVTKPLNRSNARVRNVPSRGRAMVIRHAVGPVFSAPSGVPGTRPVCTRDRMVRLHRGAPLRLAQLAERLAYIQEAGGSKPASGIALGLARRDSPLGSHVGCADALASPSSRTITQAEGGDPGLRRRPRPSDLPCARVVQRQNTALVWRRSWFDSTRGHYSLLSSSTINPDPERTS